MRNVVRQNPDATELVKVYALMTYDYPQVRAHEIVVQPGVKGFDIGVVDGGSGSGSGLHKYCSTNESLDRAEGIACALRQMAQTNRTIREIAEQTTRQESTHG